MVGRLEGKVAVVTGGGSGIGAATVKLFAAEGARVISADLPSDHGEQLAAECGASFLALDVSDPSGWERIASEVSSRFGRLDVMFNNAGVSFGQTVEEVDLQSWNRAFAINVTGVMLGSQTAFRLMKANPGGSSGSIINTASTVAFVGIPQDLAYTATKGAVRSMTKSMAVLGARQYNIRCNALIPGATLTGMLKKSIDADPSLLARAGAMSPAGRIADPSEPAAMALFLASDESRYCNGAEFVVDGGMLATHPGM